MGRPLVGLIGNCLGFIDSLAYSRRCDVSQLSTLRSGISDSREGHIDADENRRPGPVSANKALCVRVLIATTHHYCRAQERLIINA